MNPPMFGKSYKESWAYKEARLRLKKGTRPFSSTNEVSSKGTGYLLDWGCALGVRIKHLLFDIGTKNVHKFVPNYLSII